MGTQEDKFVAWFRSELCRSKPASKFVLRSASSGTRGTEIDTFEIETRLELEEIPIYAQNVLERAQADADSHGAGVTRYLVLSYRQGESKPGSRYSFRLRGEGDPDLDEEAEGDEPANMKGLMAQLMRHNEAMSRTLVMATNGLTATMARRLESADRMIEKLSQERTKMFEAIEESRGEQHARDMEMMLVDKSQGRKDQAFQKLMSLVPLVINKIVGQKALPDKSDPLMMLLEPLISGLSSEQFQAIQSTLSPEQTIMFVELLQAFQKRKQLGEAKKEN